MRFAIVSIDEFGGFNHKGMDLKVQAAVPSIRYIFNLADIKAMVQGKVSLCTEKN